MIFKTAMEQSLLEHPRAVKEQIWCLFTQPEKEVDNYTSPIEHKLLSFARVCGEASNQGHGERKCYKIKHYFYQRSEFMISD